MEVRQEQPLKGTVSNRATWSAKDESFDHKTGQVRLNMKAVGDMLTPTELKEVVTEICTLTGLTHVKVTVTTQMNYMNGK